MRRRTDLAFVDAAVTRLARVNFQSPILVSVCQTLQIAVEVLDLLKLLTAGTGAGMRR